MNRVIFPLVDRELVFERGMFAMATPLAPLFDGETLEQYKAKLVKCNTGQLEKKLRKAFPNLTDVQVAAINRQGWIDQLAEQKKSSDGAADSSSSPTSV